MRYIILFIIAILLPIFAFLNFAQDEGNFASISFTSPVSAPSDSAEDKKANERGEEGDAAAETPEGGNKASESAVRRTPQVQYTAPANFPLAAISASPYLESFKSPNFFPVRNWDVGVENPEAASTLVLEPGSQKALQHKNIFESRPIASLSKLMTALVVIEEMELASEVAVSDNAVAAYGDRGSLAPDETLSVENLLYVLLMESSNDAAIALEEHYNSYRTENDKTFVAAMNKKAREIGLLDTFFAEPSGLNVNNRSTAYDLARLADYVFQRPILRQIMSTQVIDVQSQDGLVNHHLVNSNTLLGALPGVLAGKTGYTDEAGESIILYVKKSKNMDDYLIYVVLGSKDRIKTARQLIDWTDRAYIWE